MSARAASAHASVRRRGAGALVPLLACLALTSAACPSSSAPAVRHPAVGCTSTGAAGAAPPHGISWPTFHGDRARTGWNDHEATLTPAILRGHGLTLAWQSPALDEVDVSGTIYAPHAYASPLYADDVPVAACGGAPLSVLFAATTSGYVYAVNAFEAAASGGSLAAGTILWSTMLAAPIVVPKLDGSLPLGVLGTPVLDLTQSPPRLYVTAIDAAAGWRVFAVDATTGAILPGWPVTIDDAATSATNENGPARFLDATVLSQRGALDLSADGRTLYVPFGGYFDGSVGWMVAVDTVTPRVLAATSSAASMSPSANGGIWSAGGAAIDDDGFIYAETGNSPPGSAAARHVWGESLLQWRRALTLSATYTPFNYCELDRADADLGGASPMVLPDLDPTTTSTPKLLAMGSKQGNVYLIDRTHLGGGLDARPSCDAPSSQDGSLLPPDAQPQFGARGPLNVFGPYSETYGSNNYAKMRTTPAYFRAPSGSFLFVTGSSKTRVDAIDPAPPSVARLRVVTAPALPAYLAIDAADTSLALLNPGSPVVTSDASTGVVVWVLDENAQRLTPLVSPSTPRPILYAIDGTTLAPLWNSGSTLEVGGKYMTPVVAHGTVFVVTDRVQAFAPGP